MSPRVLMIYWHHGGGMRYAVQRHLRSLDAAPVRVEYVNAFAPLPRLIRRAEFDAVVLHTVFLGMRWHEDFDEFARAFSWLRDAAPVKLAIPQDEYDYSETLDEWLQDLGVTTVFTNFPDDRLATLYPRLYDTAIFRPALTGYIHDDDAARCAAAMRPLEQRPYDIVYRATKLPYWFGSHGQLKHRIGDAVAEVARARGFAVDISTRPEDTIYGDAWLDFLMSGRAIIGAESGSSVLDRRGEVQRRVRELLARDPTLTFEEVDAQMPAGWDSYAFYAISPRHLEAVVTKTCQVLVKGSYDGLLQPYRHYLPLEEDFSNLSDILDELRDHAHIAEITERAYQDVYLNGSVRYSDFARAISEEVPRQPFRLRRAIAPAIVSGGRAATRVEQAVRRRAQAAAARARGRGGVPLRSG